MNGTKLKRKNLLVDQDDLDRIKELYQVTSDSAAVRRACDLVLLAEETEEIAQRIRAMGGPEDVFGRLGGEQQPLPAWPEDEPPVLDVCDEMPARREKHGRKAKRSR